MLTVGLAAALAGSVLLLARWYHAERAQPAVELFPRDDAGEGREPAGPPRVTRLLALGIGAAAAIWALVALGNPWLDHRRPASSQSLDGLAQQLTSIRGVEALPTLSPDGSAVAYRAEIEGSGDIVVRDLDSEQVSNLTRRMNADESDPAFSPDGRRIAFRSTQSNGGLFVVGRDGGEARRLTAFGSSPAWTPDGGSIVFATGSSLDPRGWSGVSEGWIVNVASGRAWRLTRGDFRQPAVSPDGRRIAYWAVPRPIARRRVTPGIWTIGIDGRTPRPVAPGPAMDWSPVWSPDGAFLYFLSDRGGTTAIWRVAMDPSTGATRGGPVRMAARASTAAHLTIDASGRRLAWSTLEWSPSLFRTEFDADTRSTHGTPAAIATGSLSWRCAEPSPDGTTLALASDQGQSDIYLLRPGEPEARAVTADAAVEGCPRWSPDGTRIAFHSNSGGLNNVWLAAADGSGLRPAGSAIGELTHPAWTPDGRSVVAWDAYRGTLRVLALGDALPSAKSEALPVPTHPFTPVAWSPDGTLLAGTAVGSIWIYFRETKTYQSMVPGTAPTWLSGSRRLVYAADGRLVMLDVPSRFTREILSMPDLHLDAPFISPDDRVLYFTRNATETNIWVLTLR